MSKITSIYCDGGCIGRNPSPLGGTFAWIALDENEVELANMKGVIKPEDYGMKHITNNFSELIAAVTALSFAFTNEKRWDGTIYTDSLITLYRITNGTGFKGVPNYLRLQTLDIRRNRKYKVVLLRGHPNKKELQAGISKGRPVSKWNVWCDKQCQKLAEEAKQNNEFTS